MYIKYGKIFIPPPPQILFFPFKFFYLLMVSDKTIHKAFRNHKTLNSKQLNPFMEILYFHFSPKLCFASEEVWNLC